ncbi:hypothetical protein NMY22_g15528 [Coprinellus aureogranulatus]|nr:hypothetical protein NMY22_g15528 [Coprinellus aureogranulatus]
MGGMRIKEPPSNFWPLPVHFPNQPLPQPQRPIRPPRRNFEAAAPRASRSIREQSRHSPARIGLLTQLKELYLFDNHLTTLPPEIGCLHQLQTLGIEGNPLDTNLKSIIQKDGTSALVCWLRDNSLDTPAPPPRQWKNLLTVRVVAAPEIQNLKQKHDFMWKSPSGF